MDAVVSTLGVQAATSLIVTTSGASVAATANSVAAFQCVYIRSRLIADDRQNIQNVQLHNERSRKSKF